MMNTRYDEISDNNIKIVDDYKPSPYASVTKLKEGNVEVKILKNEDFGLNITGISKKR